MKTFTIIAVAALATATATPVSAGISGPIVHAQTALRTGALVRSSEGSELGRLEARRARPVGGVEIVVRGPDGRLRAIPASAASVNGDELHVTWTMAEFLAADVIADPGGTGASGGDQTRSSAADQATRRDDAVDRAGDATRPRIPEQNQVPESTEPEG